MVLVETWPSLNHKIYLSQHSREQSERDFLRRNKALLHVLKPFRVMIYGRIIVILLIYCAKLMNFSCPNRINLFPNLNLTFAPCSRKLHVR